MSRYDENNNYDNDNRNIDDIANTAAVTISYLWIHSFRSSNTIKKSLSQSPRRGILKRYSLRGCFLGRCALRRCFLWRYIWCISREWHLKIRDKWQVGGSRDQQMENKGPCGVTTLMGQSNSVWKVMNVWEDVIVSNDWKWVGRLTMCWKVVVGGYYRRFWSSLGK